MNLARRELLFISMVNAVLDLPGAGAPLDRSQGWTDSSHYLSERKVFAGDVSLVLNDGL